MFMEVPAGVEPALAELQSAALPLGYGTIFRCACLYYQFFTIFATENCETFHLTFGQFMLYCSHEGIYHKNQGLDS